MSPADEEVFDSPTRWVRTHIRGYVDSGGTKGHQWRGTHTLLLTTRGRKTGKLRRTALIYGRDGDRYLLVASQGGAKKHPSWYLNLVANPEVRIQVGPDVLDAKARTAAPDEKLKLWPTMSKIWPDYDTYQAKTTRDIPVVIVEATTA
jgi:deazaflavin-dependent oxidoreductase (nitroreductase family)